MELAVVGDGFKLTEEQRRRRRSRNVAIGLILGALVALFYVITIVRMGLGVQDTLP
jgi:hypothetical protein